MPLFTVCVFAVGITFGVLLTILTGKLFRNVTSNKNCDYSIMLALVERNHTLHKELTVLKCASNKQLKHLNPHSNSCPNLLAQAT